tara:strand:+ start:196 stop:1020 length:825 start_codon:yes stop_codon:yes gene_type:complete
MLPFVEQGRQNIKTGIITTLSYQYPMSAKGLYFLLKKRYRLGVGYHAVYKAMQELVEKEVIEKEKMTYQLTDEWINRNFSFAQQVKKHYADKQAIAVPILSKDKPTCELRFKNILELDKYSMALHNKFYPKLGDEEIVCMIYQHQWWHLLHPMKEYEAQKTNKRFYFVCGGKTPLDKQANIFKKRNKFNVVTADMARMGDTTIYGDVVISIYYEPTLRAIIEKWFQKTKTVEELDVPKMVSEVFKKDTEILVILNKNKALANQLRANVLTLFGK